MSMIQSDLLLGQEGGAGYTISRSLRFNSSDSAYLSRTPASAGNRKTWTWSGWVKRSRLGVRQALFAGHTGGAGNYNTIEFITGDSIVFFFNGTGSGPTTTALFRDLGAWMHVCVALDTTQATASDRVKIYVNGALQAIASGTYPAQNADLQINAASQHDIGVDGGYDWFNGYLADIHFIDGQALDPTSFTDVGATTGRLEPKQYSGPTPTGNSFWLPFSDNSAATGTALGKDGFLLGNNWTPNNIQVASSSTTNWTSRTSISSGSIWGWSYLSWIFDVNTATGTHSQGAITYSFSPGIPASGSLRLNIGCNVYHDPNVMIAVSINGAGYGTFPGAVAWRTIGWAGGTINSITLQGTNSGNAQALETFLNAIEVNGVQLIDNAAAQNDSLVDTPTSYGIDTGAGGEVRGNYATLNPLNTPLSATISNGNLSYAVAVNNGTEAVFSTIAVSSGKWYVEYTETGTFGRYNFPGVQRINGSISRLAAGFSVDSWSLYSITGNKYNNGTATAYATASAANGVIGVALDLDNGTLTFYRDGVSLGAAFTGLPAGTYAFSGGAGITVGTLSFDINFGQRPFAYTAPSGFKALCDQNLPAPTIARPSTVMDVKLWTGNSGTQNITGLAFSPDLAWVKGRTGILNHVISDTIRGTNLKLASNTTGAETGTDNGTISAFTSDGITVAMGTGTYPGYETNLSTYPYVGWFWDAGSSTVTNTAGSITSTVRANPSAGFSVVTWSYGNAPLVGHGLNVAPSLIIAKSRTVGYDWVVYHRSLGRNAPLVLNDTAAAYSIANYWGSSEPSSTVFGTYGTGGNSNNAGDMVAYCWAPVAGYSSAFSYSGSGSSDGPMVWLGFRPRLILIKRSDSTASWQLYDTARGAYNVVTQTLAANESTAESGFTSGYDLDILSTGFKIRAATSNAINSSGGTYIGFAWAESPFQYARAR